MKQQCCVCKKLHQDGEWTRKKPAADDQVSHTYCPKCYGAAIRAIKAEVALANARCPLAAVS